MLSSQATLRQPEIALTATIGVYRQKRKPGQSLREMQC
jgi:hypothetical protein